MTGLNNQQHLANDEANTVELRVSGTTPPKELAASIVHNLSQGKIVHLAAIGHQAIGQAVKSLPIANTYTTSQGFQLTMFPYFELKHIPNESDGTTLERTAMIMRLVKIRPL